MADQLHQKWRAYAAVKRAIEAGKLHRPDRCERCHKVFKPRNGKAQIEAHHWHGYGKAHELDVIWLCVSCNNLAKDKEAIQMSATNKERAARRGRAALAFAPTSVGRGERIRDRLFMAQLAREAEAARKAKK